jgi:hypothetical protein
MSLRRTDNHHLAVMDIDLEEIQSHFCIMRYNKQSHYITNHVGFILYHAK